MKTLFKFCLCMIVLFFESCTGNKEESINQYSLGEASYYPSFLWSEEKMVPIEKTLEATFNDAALRHKANCAVQFVDGDCNPIEAKTFVVYANGVEAEDGIINICDTDKEIKITITPDKQLNSTHLSGYLKIVDSNNLDRIEEAEDGIILKWNFKYHRNWNPLAKALTWIGIIVGALLLLWFILFRPIFYPRFGTVMKVANIPNAPPVLMRFCGCREVVLSNASQKQSWLDRVFKGKIKYYVSPNIVSPIKFSPSTRGRILVKLNYTHYSISPNPMPKFGKSELTDKTNNSKIIIQ